MPIKSSPSIFASVLVVVAVGCSPSQEATAPTARFVKQVDWVGKGTWLRVDTHSHTKFSDGSYPLETVVEKAVWNEVDVLAITDHSDKNLTAATEAYFEAFKRARQKYPDLILIAGLEWNVPPWGGDEHATVLFPKSMETADSMEWFKHQFDDYQRRDHNAELADAALRWLAKQQDPTGQSPIVILNHPSRKLVDPTEMVDYFLRWRSVNDTMIGFSGAPGHQKNPKDNGNYKLKLKTIDRWDPTAAELNGAWDQLLRKGIDLWAARAPSDFHKEDVWDYWPGEFSETWVYAPERTAEGFFKAMRAGTFFGVHGHIAREVHLKVNAQGLERPAEVGEIIEIASGTSITIELSALAADRDWQELPNQIDELELILIGPNDVDVHLGPGGHGNIKLKHTIEAVESDLVVRARGRRLVEGTHDLLFYTNPIRIQVR